jgi:5-methylcytosine-specific restriction endonuclease McrA/DNA-binding CsgD family transcriptional regulator
MQCQTCFSALTVGQRKFCSKRCNDRWRYSVPSVSFTCGECGSTVLIPANKVTRRRYCSRSCATAAYNRTHLRGPRNGNWRGGRALYYGTAWKTARDAARARDRVCQHCGKTADMNGRALDVHHVEPFRFSGDNSIENLIALCHSCHMRADDHGRSGSAEFLRKATAKHPTKRGIRRLKQLMRAAEARALRRQRQREATTMEQQGLSLREIARALGVSHETISNWLKGHHRVQEAAARYTVKRFRRPRGRPLLSCPPLRPGSSVGRARV